MRIIYRLIEYSRGLNTNNPLPFHEAYMYVLDVMPMFTALIILNVWHPGRVLVGPDSSFPKLTRKEKKALKAEKKAIKAEKKAQKSERKRGGKVEQVEQPEQHEQVELEDGRREGMWRE